MSQSSKRSRAVDKWKFKKWYVVYAPPYFGNKEIGVTPADDPQKLLGRVIETTLYDITGDFNQIHVLLRFQIIKIEGENAYTRFKGHEWARDYLRSLIRRKTSKVEGIFFVRTKDGYRVKTSCVAFTVSRAKTSQKYAIRKIMQEVIEKRAKELNFKDFVQECVLGKIGSEIYNLAKKIMPLRKCDVWKTEVLEVPPEALEKELSEIAAVQETTAAVATASSSTEKSS
ncbi:MAG: 30S ribosomal protein S3ae [Candidatus Baldrarchaeia archaeon]